MRKWCKFFLLVLAFLPMSGRVLGEEYIGKFSPSQLSELARLSREGIESVVKRRPTRNTNVGLKLMKAKNGVFLHVLSGGRVVAGGSGFDSSLMANIRLAAGSSVYNKNIRSIDESAVFTEVCGRGRRVPTPVFHRMRRGREAYCVEYNSRKLYMSALEPVINGWSWRQTLLEMTKRLLSLQEGAQAEGAADPNKNELIRVAASPDFKLRVYPVYMVATAGRGAEALVVRAFDEPGKVAGREQLRTGLLELAEWYKVNQDRGGRYPLSLNAAAGIKDLAENNYVDALNVVALARLADYTEDKSLEFKASRGLDTLLMNHFFENPENEEGYIKNGDGVALADSAAALWAISALGLDVRNEEIARIAGRLGRFVLSQQEVSGEFRPWYQPRGKRAKNGAFGAVAIIALLDWRVRQHSAQVLKSSDYYRSFYTAAAGAHPPVEVIGWYTMAASMVYRHTQQRAYAQWIFEMNSVLARQWLKNRSLTKKNAGTARDAALAVIGLSEALYLQKLAISSGQKSDRLRLELFTKALQDAAGYLLGLQVRSGAETLLMPVQSEGIGAFRHDPGGIEIRLEDNLLAVMALQRAMLALDGGQ